MAKHSDEIVRQDIINAGKLILEFIEGFDKKTFVKDRKTRSVDWDEVWQTARKDIPDLLRKIEQASF